MSAPHSDQVGIARLLTIALFILCHAHRILAIDCNGTTWNWASNSLGQNPCTMVEMLESSCLNSSFSLYQLAGNGSSQVTPYPPPRSGAPACECSSVMYSLYSMCTMCQNVNTTYDFSGWTTNCNQTYLSQYPDPIPSTTRLPAWTFMNLQNKSSFYWQLAEYVAFAGIPESGSSSQYTYIPPSSTGSMSTCTGSGTSTYPSIVISQVVSPGTKYCINNKVVIGLISLSVVSAGMAAGMVFLLYRRRRPEITAETPDVVAPSISIPTWRKPKLYDPSDPSTFPSSTDGSVLTFDRSPQSPAVSTFLALKSNPSLRNSVTMMNRIGGKT